jgi:uncharacterized protein
MKAIAQRTVLRARTVALCACGVALTACLLTSCEKKPQPLNAAQVRSITREFVFAAKNASDGRVQTGMFPERQAGNAPAIAGALGRGQQPAAPPSPDLIFVTLPYVTGGKTDDAVLRDVVNEMDRAAQVHGLVHVPRPGTAGIFRFDYYFAGTRTHTINIVTPVVPQDEARLAASREPKLAIIIDDLGYDVGVAESVFQIPFPLTVSVLPHLQHSAEIAEEATRRGYQVLLHLPIESNADDKAETIELRRGMPADEVTQLMQGMLATVPQAVGVNNHQGSAGTSDATLMNEVMPALRERDLFFVDSRTAATTVAFAAARSAHVPTASRDVFLDDEDDVAAIRQQLDLAVHDAKLHGSAIAIGHPKPNTLQVLSEDLPQVQHEGIALVFASQVVH